MFAGGPRADINQAGSERLGEGMRHGVQARIS